MRGKWERTCMVLDDVYKHIATRILDISEPIHGGNIEHIGGYTSDKESVEKLCNYLNELEARK